MKRYVLGDPQAPFASIMALLDRYGLLGGDGQLRANVQLVSIGDHFDYDLNTPEESRAEGLAVLRWFAAHSPEQVQLIFGNHDAARVVELALVDDREFADARALALSIETTKRDQSWDAGKQRERDEFLPRFPTISTTAIAARDYASFSVEQRDLVTELLHAGRFHLALTGTLEARPVLLTHAGVTTRETSSTDPETIAAALEQVFATAIASWQPGTRLSLEPLSQAGAPGQEAGGLLAHRPTNPERANADPAWELDRTRPRRFGPRELPRGLTQIAGHTNHPMCSRELVPWVTPRAAATRYAGIRTLRAADAITYDLGVLPPLENAADLILVDGELRDPHNRAELLEIG
jgi:hypothetical protein